MPQVVDPTPDAIQKSQKRTSTTHHHDLIPTRPGYVPQHCSLHFENPQGHNTSDSSARPRQVTLPTHYLLSPLHGTPFSLSSPYVNLAGMSGTLGMPLFTSGTTFSPPSPSLIPADLRFLALVGRRILRVTLP
ncbi:hypothetical protein J3458_000111 [Metarhizium acridum]|uniref:uncharacterized protein n=1 Tax=Metarhizium acridum TaxID=92637 RepID=UPI001C6C5691|nr:hypothetical protein J3458_000111 [Metarhizium acridum]